MSAFTICTWHFGAC